MIYFTSDYCEGAHPAILERMSRKNFDQNPGYGMDAHCARAAELIRAQCGRDVHVHFLVGGTQANLTVISAALRPHQAAVCAQSGHINVHETGAVEATGHKILTLPSADGKIRASQVRELVLAHRSDESMEHTAQPRLVYISNPTEYGTIYRRAELEALRKTCRELGLYLFLDGARLGYGLRCRESDVSLADLARLCDAFYIGGTKVGALFGEAVVLTNPALQEDFRYLIKRHGGMLAKGWLLGIQFETLFEDGLYWRLSDHALEMADILRKALEDLGCPWLVDSPTNQLFPIVENRKLEKLRSSFAWTHMEAVDESHTAIRLCTSWATREADVRALVAALQEA